MSNKDKFMTLLEMRYMIDLEFPLGAPFAFGELIESENDETYRMSFFLLEKQSFAFSYDEQTKTGYLLVKVPLNIFEWIGTLDVPTLIEIPKEMLHFKLKVDQNQE